MPNFALTYRFLQAATVEAGLRGEPEIQPAIQPEIQPEAKPQASAERKDVARSADLLQRYRRRLERFFPELRSILGEYFGPAPPQEDAAAFFDRVIERCGTLASATMEMVSKFGVTFFGRYCCHAMSAKG